MDPSAAQPAHRTRAIFVRHRQCRVQQGRWCDRTGASGPVGRPCDGGLRGFAIAPRPRHRDQRVEDTDPVRLDHPRPVSSRAIYRALEHQLHPRRGSGRIPARGPAPQPPGDRRHPAGHAAVCDNATLTAALSSVTRRRPHRRGLRRRSCTTSRIISAINSPRVIGDHDATAQRIPVCSSASALSLARSLRLVVTISFPTPESKTRPMGPPATR